MSTSKSDSVTPSQTANIADVTLNFAGWLHEVRGKFWIHLVHDVSALKNIRLWDWGEDGGFYHWYHTQHEKSKRARHEYPASRDHSTHYYDEDTLPHHRPSKSHFTKSKYSYPLQHTREIVTCPNCSGLGEVKCGSCGGRRRCRKCGGDGHTGSGKDRKTCSSCRGSGRCSNCKGSGTVRCEKCKGEGKLLRYESKDYEWWHDEDARPILSKAVDRSRVKRMIKAARNRGGGVVIQEFSEDEVLRSSGVVNDRIRILIQLANARRRELEAEIAARSHLVVFQDNERQYIPFSYINMSAGGKYGQYFAAGTEKHCESRRPRLPIDMWKCALWSSLLAAITVTAFASLDVWVPVALWVLTVGLIGFNVHRLYRELQQPPPSRWLILDDAEHRAWQFAYVLAQAISRDGVGCVADPWFTALLEPPTTDSVKGRHSFMVTIRHNQPEAPRQTEIVLLGKRSQDRNARVVRAAIQSATRLVWLAGGRTAEELDKAIVEVLALVSEEDRPRIEVAVIRDEQARQITVAQLTQAREKLGPERLQVVDIPIGEMCNQTFSGNVSEIAELGFKQLVEFSGWFPAPIKLPEVEEQSEKTTIEVA